MKRLTINGRRIGWEFGNWRAITRVGGGYDLYRDMVHIGWFLTLRTARMYAVKEDYKDN